VNLATAELVGVAAVRVNLRDKNVVGHRHAMGRGLNESVETLPNLW
jgi:hypothetical protein